MATDAPLSRLVLRATSVADDLGYVALADLAHVFGKDADYRVIGGHMVTALVARWNLGAKLYRETDDTDIGVKQRNVFVNDYAPRTRCDRECHNARCPCLTSPPVWHLVHHVCCPDAPCFEERPCLHLAFLTSREATVLRARLIRASSLLAERIPRGRAGP